MVGMGNQINGGRSGESREERIHTGYVTAQNFKYPEPKEIYDEEVNGIEAARGGYVENEPDKGIFLSQDISQIVHESNSAIEMIKEYYSINLGLSRLPGNIEDITQELKYRKEDYQELLESKDVARNEEDAYRYGQKLESFKQAVRTKESELRQMNRTFEELESNLQNEKAVVAKSRNKRIKAYQAGVSKVWGNTFLECSLEDLLAYYGAIDD